MWNSAGERRGALRTHDQPLRDDHLLSALATGVSHADDNLRPEHDEPSASDSLSAVVEPAPPSGKELRRLIRLARVAQTWRDVTGFEAGEADNSQVE